MYILLGLAFFTCFCVALAYQQRGDESAYGWWIVAAGILAFVWASYALALGMLAS